MAGIGFELKKLFEKKSITAKVTGILYSVFSTIGHLLIVIVILIAVRIFLLNSDLGLENKQLYAAIILYSFVFPLIFTSGICICVSRYIADMMWQYKESDILASVYGVLALYCVLVSPIALVFLYFAKLGFALSLFSYLLFMLVGIVFILMVYVSALKDYVQISVSFITGMAVTFITSYYAIFYREINQSTVTVLIGCFALGMTIIASGIFIGIRKYFKISSNKYFSFLSYFKKYPYLIFSNFLYTFGMYSQNFVFWINPGTRDHINIFVYSDNFDLATAFGVVTILSAIVMFVVRMETSFYKYYRAYLKSVNSQTGAEIETAKILMKRRMWQEYLYIAEIQILISLAFIVVGLIVLPKIGITSQVIDMFPSLTAGFLLTYFTFLSCTLLQYFENYADSFRVMLLFVVLNPIFAYITVLLGSAFYGIGLFFAASATLIASIIYLIKTLNSVDYIIFCSHSLISESPTVWLEKTIDFLNGKETEEKTNENISKH